MIHAAIASYPEYMQNSAKSSLPFIVDDSFETISEELSGGPGKDLSLLVGSETSKSFLPLSGYSKTHYSVSKDFANSRDDMYIAHAQPGMAPPHLQSIPVPYTRPEEPSYASGSIYSQRPAEDNAPNYGSSPNGNDSLQPRRIPEISSWSPQRGSAGTQISIYLLSAYDLDPSWTFHATFAEREIQCTLTVMPREGAYSPYMLSTEVPEFGSSWTNATVPLRIHAQDGLGNNMGIAMVGSFTYTDVMQPTGQGSPDVPRKRKLSIDSNESRGQPAKRTAKHEGGGGSFDQPQYGYGQQEATSYMQQPSMLAIDTSVANLIPEYQAPTPGHSAHSESPRHVTRHLHTRSTSSVGQMRRPSPVAPSWNPTTAPSTPAWNPATAPSTPAWNPTAAPPSHSRNHTLSVTPMPRTVGSSPTMANPPLIRTSTLQQSPSPASTPSGTPASGHFNPYGMYPHKAILKINGDLEDMTQRWDEGEMGRQRRLVQFRRSQSGSTINTSFEPVSPEERQPNSICISCIWWESKKEHYVTSVDTIYLLESLVAVRFTVEEKNRIRRNLEGFRPETVSKNKAISEDLFKLIMGFPAPKPRNIEKDVKVFPWKILAHALKKIIGKYSASYSSTAGATNIQAQPAGMYRGGQAQHEYLTPNSPDSNSGSSIGHSYHNSLPSTTSMSSSTLSPPTSSQVRLPVSYATANSSMASAAQNSTYPIFSYPPQHLNQAPPSNLMSLMIQQNGGPGGQQPHHRVPQHKPEAWQQQPKTQPWEYNSYMDAPTSGPTDHSLYSMDTMHHGSQYHLTHASSGA